MWLLNPTTTGFLAVLCNRVKAHDRLIEVNTHASLTDIDSD